MAKNKKKQVWVICPDCHGEYHSLSQHRGSKRCAAKAELRSYRERGFECINTNTFTWWFVPTMSFLYPDNVRPCDGLLSRANEKPFRQMFCHYLILNPVANIPLSALYTRYEERFMACLRHDRAFAAMVRDNHMERVPLVMLLEASIHDLQGDAADLAALRTLENVFELSGP